MIYKMYIAYRIIKYAKNDFKSEWKCLFSFSLKDL